MTLIHRYNICRLQLFPVLSLKRRQLLSGVSADFLKVNFPVVICQVLTVYFLTDMLNVCS